MRSLTESGIPFDCDIFAVGVGAISVSTTVGDVGCSGESGVNGSCVLPVLEPPR